MEIEAIIEENLHHLLLGMRHESEGDKAASILMPIIIKVAALHHIELLPSAFAAGSGQDK